jgi:DNA-binding winged helix-turn-helix (wHTH) protein/Tol biopolymer transport system component
MRPPTAASEPKTAPRRATHAFGSFTVDTGARKLWRNGQEAVALPSRAFDTLVYLIEQRDRLVDKEELLRHVWPDVIVTDDSLIHAVSVLRRALADDPSHAQYIETVPRRGYRFVGTLREAEPAPSPASAPALATVPPSLAAARPRKRLGVAAYIAAATLGASIIGGAWLRQDPPAASENGSALRLFQPPPPGTRIESGGVLSPDARHLAFVARDQETGTTALWLRSLHAAEALRLAGTDGAAKPFWSPDSRRIAFFASGRLAAVDLLGEAPHAIATDIDAPAGGTWGPDDTIVFADWPRGIFAVPAAGDERPRPLRALDRAAQQIAHTWPQFLPDGHRFIYQVVSLDAEQTGIYVGDLESNTADTRLLATDSPAVFAPPSHIVHVDSGMLVAEELDASMRALTGRTILLSRDVTPPSLGDGDVVSAAGNLIAFRGGARQQNLSWLDRTGEDVGALSVPKVLFNPRLSPDGASLLASSSPTNDPGLWRARLERAEYTRLETDAVAPLWSPDGERIAFTARGSVDVLVRSALPTGVARPLLSGGTVKILNDWAPDGDEIIYTQAGEDTRLDLWHVSARTGIAAPLLASEFNELQARVSPDGRWIAYASDESGTLEVYVRRYPHLDEQRRISHGGGGQPQWRGDAGEIFFVSTNRALMAVELAPGHEVTFGTPTELFRLPIAGGPMDARDHYAASADGQRFLVDGAAESEHRAPITLLINWTALASDGAPGPAVALSNILH